MPIQQALTVSQLVRADYRLADVFTKWGIDYGGSELLEEACRRQRLDLEKVTHDMQQAQQNIRISNTLSFEEWPVGFLVDYLIYVHHAYIKKAGPPLLQTLEAFAKDHPEKSPHLLALYGHFKKLLAAITEQLQYEEEVIFPYLKQVANALKRRESYGPLFVRTLRKSLAETTSKAQQQSFLLLTHLREATQQYQFPENACTAHQVIYQKLQEFDADLVQHKHLENHILFPKVVQMEGDLLRL